MGSEGRGQGVGCSGQLESLRYFDHHIYIFYDLYYNYFIL